MSALKHSILYLFGEVFSKSIPFLMLPYLTRTLGVEGYGQIALYQTLILFIIIFLSISQEGAISRYYFRYGKSSLGNLVFLGYGYNLSLSLLMMISAYFLKFSIDWIVLIFISSLQAMLNVQLVLNQCQKKVKKYLLIQLLSGGITSLSVLFFFEILLLKDGQYWLVANLIGCSIVFFISILMNRKDIKLKKLTWNNAKLYFIYIFSFGIPLLVHQLSSFSKGHVEKMIINNNFSLQDLGEYSAALQIASVLTVLFMALNKALLPHYYQWLKNNKNVLLMVKRSLIKVFIISCIFPMVAFLIPKEVYGLLLGKDFLNIKYYILLFVIGYSTLPMYLILVNYLFYYGKTKLISYISLSSVCVYLIFVALFSTMSINYMPLSLIISNVVLLVILYYYVFYKRVS